MREKWKIIDPAKTVKKGVAFLDGPGLSRSNVDTAIYWITPYLADQLQPSCKTN